MFIQENNIQIGMTVHVGFFASRRVRGKVQAIVPDMGAITVEFETEVNPFGTSRPKWAKSHTLTDKDIRYCVSSGFLHFQKQEQAKAA